MPSTRGMGSKMICCCSLALSGVISVQADFSELEPRTILRPADSGIVNGVAILSQLHDDLKPDRLLRNPLFDLVEEEVRPLCCRSGLVQIFIACHRQHPIAPVAAHARPRW